MDRLPALDDRLWCQALSDDEFARECVRRFSLTSDWPGDLGWAREWRTICEAGRQTGRLEMCSTAVACIRQEKAEKRRKDNESAKAFTHRGRNERDS